jgi:putative transposase
LDTQTISNKDSRFVVEVELNPTSQQKAIIKKRFRVTCQMYNLLLKEYESRYNKFKYHPLLKEYKATKEKKKKTEILKSLKKECGLYSDYDSYNIMSSIRNRDNTFKLNMASATGQALGVRAFQVWDNYITAQLFTKEGEEYKRPRYKRYSKYESVASSSAQALSVKALKNQNLMLHWATNKDKKNILSIPLIVNNKDLFHNYVFTYENGLLAFRDPEGPCITKVVKRVIRGVDRYFLQMTMKGLSPIIYKNHYANTGLVGLDVGTQTLGIVADNESRLVRFCSELDVSENKVAALNQKIDVKKRVNNPSNFNPNGTNKKKEDIIQIAKEEGRSRVWHISRNEWKLRCRRNDIKRKQAAYRKSLHGKLVNEICRLGADVHTEKVCVKGWQKVFGKSIGNRAPGMFQSLLKTRLNTLNGNMNLIITNKTALSQHCVCGSKVEKNLSQRVHKCGVCGFEMQRDLMSAYLARYVSSSGKTDNLDNLNLEQARLDIDKFVPHMKEAWDNTEVK